VCLGGGASRRCHEFRADRINDGLIQDAIDFDHCRTIDLPTQRAGDRRKLIGAARAPQGDARSISIEHPADRKVDNAPVKPLLGQTIELFNRRELLRESRRPKFRIAVAQIVTAELA
jgi:hypothetical protein